MDTYLGVIYFTRAEECLKRVISRDHKAGQVDEELSSNVEEDKEEVETGKTQDSIDFGDAGLLFEIIEELILGQFLVELRHLVLCLILERHVDNGGG